MPDSRAPILAALSLHSDARRALGLDPCRMAVEGPSRRFRMSPASPAVPQKRCDILAAFALGHFLYQE